MCRKDGAPLDDKSLYKIVWTATYRLTGIRMNPHLIRDSIVTFARQANVLTLPNEYPTSMLSTCDVQAVRMLAAKPDHLHAPACKFLEDMLRRGGGGASERELEALAIYMGAPLLRVGADCTRRIAVLLRLVLQPLFDRQQLRWRLPAVSQSFSCVAGLRRAQRADAKGKLRPTHEGRKGGAGGGASGEHHTAGRQRSMITAPISC